MTAIDFGIPQRIYRMHEKKEAASARPPRELLAPFYASEVGKCGRAITYERLGFEKKDGAGFSGKTLRIFAAGNTFEREHIQELKEAGFKVTDQQARVKLVWPPVSGKIDGIITGTIDDETVTRVLELKTANADSVADIRKRGFAVSKPEYQLQVQLYLFALKLAEATVIVGGKNDQSLVELTIEYDAVWLANQLLRLMGVVVALAEGRLAEAEYKKTSQTCRWCQFQEHCSGRVP